MSIERSEEIKLTNALNKLAGEAFSKGAAYFLAQISQVVIEGIGPEEKDAKFEDKTLNRILAEEEVDLLRRVSSEDAKRIWQKCLKGIDAGIHFHSQADQATLGVNDFLVQGDKVETPMESEILNESLDALSLEKEVYVQVGPVRIGYQWD